MVMTVQQVADKLHLSTKTIYRKVKDGTLKASKLSPHCIRIRESDIDEYLNSKQ